MLIIDSLPNLTQSTVKSMAEPGTGSQDQRSRSSRQIDPEERLREAIGNSEKGLMLLEHLRKKDPSELRKLKKKFSAVSRLDVGL